MGNVVSFVVKLAADGLSEDGETSVMLLEECMGGDLGKVLRLITSDPQRCWPHRAMEEADAKFYCACRGATDRGLRGFT